MCYRVITHTLRCDARPVLSDGHQVFVDPFATPCKCNGNCTGHSWIKPRLRCADHGCCIRTEKMFLCPRFFEKCEIQEYHQYEQRKERKPVWGFQNESFWTQGMGFQPVPWTDIPVFEEGAYRAKTIFKTSSWAPHESRDVRTVRNNLLTTGRLIAKNLSEIVNLHSDITQRRMGHNSYHGACGRVLNPWECRDLSTIASLEWALQGFIATLGIQMDLFEKNQQLFQVVKLQEYEKASKALLVSEFGVVGRDGEEYDYEPESFDDFEDDPACYGRELNPFEDFEDDPSFYPSKCFWDECSQDECDFHDFY